MKMFLVGLVILNSISAMACSNSFQLDPFKTKIVSRVEGLSLKGATLQIDLKCTKAEFFRLADGGRDVDCGGKSITLPVDEEGNVDSTEIIKFKKRSSVISNEARIRATVTLITPNARVYSNIVKESCDSATFEQLDNRTIVIYKHHSGGNLAEVE